MPRVARRRQARSVANDSRILDATVRLLDLAGWENASVLQIAQESGMSRPPILNRYGDRTGVVVAAWHERLSPSVRSALASCVATLESIPVDTRALQAALERFAHPDESLRAAIEVLLVARYQPELGTAVQETVGADLDEWLTPRRGLLSREQAARHCFVLNLALGMAVESRRRPVEQVPDLSTDIETVARALESDRAAAPLPAERAAHLLEPPEFTVEDPALRLLLAATLQEIGERGYEAATLQRIARSSGYTTGLIFRRYDSKFDLFQDASRCMLVNAEAANYAYQRRILEQSSPGVADAVLTREFMRPELRHLRTINGEQYRLSWHNDEMQAALAAAQAEAEARARRESPDLTVGRARARVFMGLSRAAGMIALSDLHPTAWDLPHDVVSVPLVEKSA